MAIFKQLSGPPDANSSRRMAFIVAVYAFGAAGLGLLINQWVPGWMAIGGMAGVGLFYLTMGAMSFQSTPSMDIHNGGLIETSSHRLSSGSNLNELSAEPVPMGTEQQTSDTMANA